MKHTVVLARTFVTNDIAFAKTRRAPSRRSYERAARKIMLRYALLGACLTFLSAVGFISL
jgi:hypothetical protein